MKPINICGMKHKVAFYRKEVVHYKRPHRSLFPSSLYAVSSNAFPLFSLLLLPSPRPHALLTLQSLLRKREGANDAGAVPPT